MKKILSSLLCIALFLALISSLHFTSDAANVTLRVYNWQDYIDEYVEFADYSDLAKEYLIKKCLARLINNKNNIQKIVEGR